MNPVLILAHNCIELTKRCVESVRKQDVETEITIHDNGSTDGTAEWLASQWFVAQRIGYSRTQSNRGVSWGWNHNLGYLLSPQQAPERAHCLVVNNDTVLPPWFYRELLSYDVPFVSGISVDSMEVAMTPPGRMPLHPSPDFSAFLLRREAWEKVGPFDENMKYYASDNDWHVRAHRAGVKLWKANVPFYHERSSTLKLAPPAEQQEIQMQADADRQVFRQKYGCEPWGPGYDELLK